MRLLAALSLAALAILAGRALPQPDTRAQVACLASAPPLTCARLLGGDR